LNYSIKKNKICAVLPFYNEEKNIEKVTEQTLNFVDLIIAVNDGSTDNSAEKISHLENVILINHDKNTGKGAALRTGFIKSMELGSEFTLTLDADGQHEPGLIPKFLERLKDYDIVIGNRLHDMKTMPLPRRLSNKLTSKLLSAKTGLKIFDSQSGFRAFRTEVLEKILPENNGFEAESEMIIKAARKNLKIGFVNIPTIYGNDESKMESVKAIKGFIKILLS